MNVKEQLEAILKVTDAKIQDFEKAKNQVMTTDAFAMLDLHIDSLKGIARLAEIMLELDKTKD